MQLTIHIGPHKTGTTAVQTACARGARALAGAGVLYPRVCWHHPAQHRLALAGKGRKLPGGGAVPDFATELTRIARVLAAARVGHAMISSEEFFAWPEEAIARLTELPVDKVRVVAFLRRPDDFLVSCYNQKIRQVGNSFHAPIARFVEDPRLIAPEIDYAACLGRWADALGEASVLPEIYEEGPPLPRLLANFGLPRDFLPDPPGVNRSVPGAAAESLRHAKIAGLTIRQQKRLSRLALQAFADHPPYYLGVEERRQIVASLEPDNVALFERFGRENPFRAARLEEATPWRQNLSNQDLVRLIGEIL